MDLFGEFRGHDEGRGGGDELAMGIDWEGSKCGGGAVKKSRSSFSILASRRNRWDRSSRSRWEGMMGVASWLNLRAPSLFSRRSASVPPNPHSSRNSSMDSSSVRYTSQASLWEDFEDGLPSSLAAGLGTRELVVQPFYFSSSTQLLPPFLSFGDSSGSFCLLAKVLRWSEEGQ